MTDWQAEALITEAKATNACLGRVLAHLLGEQTHPKDDEVLGEIHEVPPRGEDPAIVLSGIHELLQVYFEHQLDRESKLDNQRQSDNQSMDSAIQEEMSALKRIETVLKSIESLLEQIITEMQQQEV